MSGKNAEVETTGELPQTFQIARDELCTIRDYLRFAVSQFNAKALFFGHGIQSAYDEAAYLILHTLHLPIDTLEPFLNARLTRNEREAVLKILQRRTHERMPAAYLTQEAWLGEHRFYVDERVLIPRSFIAELLREGLQPWIENTDEVTQVLDLCTGSGCLAILAALTFPQAAVDAVDISTAALEVAARNVADYDLTSRVSLITSNMFDNISGRKYDLILCNPPYVTAESMATLPEEYRREPQLALASGPDGLDHIRILLKKACGYLNPQGVLVVETGFNRAGIEAAFPDLPFIWLETSAGDEVVFLLKGFPSFSCKN